MTLLQWKPEYSVGIDSMDDEHQEMMRLINDIHAELESGADADQVNQCLGDIFNTISMHFALEEKLMKDNAYDEFQAHKDDHENLLDELRDLMDDYYDNSTIGTSALEKSLSKWFSAHFSTFDARLHGKLSH